LRQLTFKNEKAGETRPRRKEMPSFDHSQKKLNDACGITQEDFDEACDALPDKITSISELVELLVNADNDVVKITAIVSCYFKPKPK
jgi:hypothetical protein